jgi:hypothetical protein
MERVWWTPSHMWQSYFLVSHILHSHFDEGHFFPFFGQPLKKYVALDGPLVFLPHVSSSSIRVWCIYLIMKNYNQN